MNASVLGLAARTATPRRASLVVAWRLALGFAVVLAVAVAAAVGNPSTFVAADPELAQLLRGMALIKGLLVVAAIAAVAWRFGRPTAPSYAVGYVVGCAMVAGSTTAIWQLSSIVPAAVAFHAAGLLLLVLAWRDGGGAVRAAMARR